MSRRRSTAIFGAAVGALVLGAALLAFRPSSRLPADTPARAAAREYYLRGLAAADSLQMTEAHRLMLRALETDPTYLPAVAFTWRDPQVIPGDVSAELIRLPGRIADPAVASCVEGRMKRLGGERAPLVAGTECASYLSAAQGDLVPGPEALAIVRRLVARYPESPDLRIELCWQLVRAARWGELLDVTREGRRLPVGPPFEGAAVVYEALALRALGRGDEAARVEAAASSAAPSWSPDVRRMYYELLAGLPNLLHIARLVDPALVKAAAAAVPAALDSEATVLRRGDDTARRWAAAGILHTRLDAGALQESIAGADSALAGLTAADPPDYEGVIRLIRGRALVKAGRPREAEPDLLRAWALLARSPWRYPAMEVAHNIFHLYEGLGRDAEARRAGRAFVEITRSHARQATRMIALRDLAQFLQQRGEVSEARPLFEGMVALVDSMGSFDAYAGEYYELIGDLDRAEYYYTRGTHDMQEDEGRAHGGLVRIAGARGDLARAERYARAYDRGIGRSFLESGRLLPGVLAAEGRWSEAAAELDAGRAEAAADGRRASWSAMTLALADVRLRAGNAAAAAALADSAATAAAEVSLPAVNAGARALAALARLRAGDDRGRELRRLGEAAALPAGTPLERADRHRLLGDGLRLGRDLDAALRAYARAADIVDSIAPSLVDPIQRAQFRERQIAITSDALAAVVERANERDSPARFATWSARRKARVLLEAGLPAGRGIRPPPVRLERIERGLGRDEAILDYAVLDDAVAVLVVTDAGSRLLRLPIGPAALSAEVRRLRAPLAARIGSVVDTARARYPLDVAARLYDGLLRPAEPLIRGRRRLTVVGDGPIHLVPFGALATRLDPGTPRAARFVLDDRIVTTAVSLASASSRVRAAAGTGVLAMVDPALPGAPAELRALHSALAGSQLRELTGAAATPGTLRALAPRAAILHLSLHAAANPQQPGYASLALPGRGGPLYAYELSSLRLRGALVVLAGCETGDGSLLDGEGVLSLGRSFLAAGAGATVATAWPVGSSAADVVAAFYRGLAAGDDPARALRAAQLHLRADLRRDPLEWAPYLFVAGPR